MSYDNLEKNQTSIAEDCQLPNLVTVVGCGVPANFEIAVSGEIDMVADNPVEEATIVSEGVAEGSIDVGIQRFRFSGECANIRAVDWNGFESLESETTPTIHVNYGLPEQ